LKKKKWKILKLINESEQLMWLYSIYELKEMIKQNCIVNGHGQKYWKQQLKQRLKLLNERK